MHEYTTDTVTIHYPDGLRRTLTREPRETVEQFSQRVTGASAINDR